MINKLKKITCIVAVIMIFLSMSFPVNINAAGKVKLNATKKTLYTGKSCTIKILNNKKKVKWSASNKNIKITSKNNKQAKIKAIKKGTSYLKAKVGSKTYKCKVTVKNPYKKGSKNNPYSAYKTYATDIYGARYYGKAKVRLLDYKDGEEALKYVKKNGVNKKIKKSQEYVYVKFQIDYFYGQEEIDADIVISPYWSFFDSKCKKQLKGKEIKCNDGVSDMMDAYIKPGQNIICKQVLLIDSGNSPISYRITTYDDNYDIIDTWFTTKR